MGVVALVENKMKSEQGQKTGWKYVKKLGKRISRNLDRFFASQSLVPDQPVFDAGDFPWLRPVAENWLVILQELEHLLQYRHLVPPFQAVSPDQAKIARGDAWRAFILYGIGTKAGRLCRHVPHTTRLLEQIPDLRNAWFSILAPGYRVPSHRGVTKAWIRVHLGLKIPKRAEKCRMRIAGQEVSWRPGELLVFDDTYRHEVWNDTDEERIVLLFDFERPMRFWGRLVSRMWQQVIRLTPYYRRPKHNLERFAAAFDALLARDGIDRLGQTP